MTVRYLTISWFYKYTSRQILKWFYLFSARLFLWALLVKFVLNMASETLTLTLTTPHPCHIAYYLFYLLNG